MIKNIATYASVGLLIIVAIVVVYVTARGTLDSSYWTHPFIKEHFRATVGLSFIAMTAGAAVFVFNSAMGDQSAKLKFWVVEFEGPASGVVLWCFAVAVLTAAVRLLW